MGSKIYVGGLPYSATEQQLSELFAAHGAVESARVITDKFTGQSRGFGFVEVGSEEEIASTIQAMNGVALDGRPPRRWPRPSHRSRGRPASPSACSRREVQSASKLMR